MNFKNVLQRETEKLNTIHQLQNIKIVFKNKFVHLFHHLHTSNTSYTIMNLPTSAMIDFR